MAIPDTIQYIYLIYKGLSSSKVSQIVHFSFDLKTIGDISADIHCYVWSHSQAFGWDVSCSVYRKWSAVTKNWPLTYSQVDSITIYYGVHGGNVGDYALIDNIKLEIRPQ
jgi:hypothetical protein